MLAPVVLFTYSRVSEAKQTIDSLRNNFLAQESDLIVFSDGGKDEQSWDQVKEVRAFLHSINGFKSIQIIESPINKGLANSVIDSVTKILESYDKIVVLEDDIVVKRNFLNYMNQALDFYEQDTSVQSINGFSPKIKTKSIDQVYFLNRTFSWGWGTWRNRWDARIFDRKIIYNVINDRILKDFKKKCGNDISKMLVNAVNNKNNSWYVFWAFDHFLKKNIAVYPVYSKTSNLGFNKNGTHCLGINTYISLEDNGESTRFKFIKYERINKEIEYEFLKYFRFVHKLWFRLKLLKNLDGIRQVINEIENKYLRRE